MSTRSDQKWSIPSSAKSKIDALFANCTNSTPGAAMAIYRDGEIEYANGYGMANLENGIPNTPNSVYDIASMSKQFTAMCIALLQNDGLLDVDNHVQKYVPELPEWDHPVTIRHLIHHTSGLRDYLGVLPMVGWRDEDQMTNADCLKYISRQRALEFEPGTDYAYSNSGYVLLAIIVERVSGKPMAAFAQERILEPLGMQHSIFNDDHTNVIPNRAQAYKQAPDGTYKLNMMPLDDLVGDGGLFTSVVDFGKWIANFSAGIVGGADLLKQHQTPGTYKNGEPMDYAWGLGIHDFHGFQQVGHSGGWAGYTSNYFRLPELGLGVVVIANGPNIAPGPTSERIAEIVLHDLISKEESSETNDEPKPDPFADLKIVRVSASMLEGKYVDEANENHLVVSARDDQPFVKYWFREVTFTTRDDGSFTSDWDMIQLAVTTVDHDGRIETLAAYSPRSDERVLLHRSDTTASIELAEYSGSYFCDELDCTWFVEESTVEPAISVAKPRSEGELFPWISQDYFGIGGMILGISIQFHRDADGNVRGFTYAGARVGTFEFERQ